MKYNIYSKLIIITFFFYCAVIPKAFSKPLDTTSLSTFSSHSKYFSFGIGYQYFFWGYDLARRGQDGSLTVIHQASQYHGMNLNAKFTAFRPWGFLTSINIYFPFSITESVYFSQNKTNSKAQVIRNGTYLLKNISISDILKGIGVTSVIGVNYGFENKNQLGNIGIGLSWIVFSEDLYGHNKQNRTSSMLGFVLDGDYQFRFSDIFGVSIGTRFTYYPIALFSINNIIGDYSIKTTSMLEYSFSFAPVFSF